MSAAVAERSEVVESSAAESIMSPQATVRVNDAVYWYMDAIRTARPLAALVTKVDGPVVDLAVFIPGQRLVEKTTVRHISDPQLKGPDGQFVRTRFGAWDFAPRGEKSIPHIVFYSFKERAEREHAELCEQVEALQRQLNAIRDAEKNAVSELARQVAGLQKELLDMIADRERDQANAKSRQELPKAPPVTPAAKKS